MAKKRTYDDEENLNTETQEETTMSDYTTKTMELPDGTSVSFPTIGSILASLGVETPALENAAKVKEAMGIFMGEVATEHAEFLAGTDKTQGKDNPPVRRLQKDRDFRCAIPIEGTMLIPCHGYLDANNDLQHAEGHNDIFSIGTPGALYEKTRCPACQAAWATAHGKTRKGGTPMPEDEKLKAEIAKLERAKALVEELGGDVSATEAQISKKQDKLDNLMATRAAN